jgi:hypothetical protein
MTKDKITERIQELEKELEALKKNVKKVDAMTADGEINSLVRDNFCACTKEKYGRYDLTVVLKNGTVYGNGGDTMYKLLVPYHWFQDPDEVAYLQIVDFDEAALYCTSEEHEIKALFDLIHDVRKEAQ